MNTISKEKRFRCNYRKSKLYQKYSNYCLTVHYDGERHAQSDRNKLRRHLANKSVRRRLERELDKMMQELITHEY